MSLFLARRWKQQPQNPLQVDWGNSLSRGLCAAWHPAARQYIGPGVATFPTPGTFAYQSDPTGGFGVRFNGLTDSRIALPAGSAGTAGYSGTRLVLFRPYGNFLGLVSGTVASTLGMRLFNATQIALVSASNTVVGSGNIPVLSGPTVALCTANDVSTETRMHCNGQLLVSATGTYASSSAGLWVGAITNQQSDANFFLALSWDRPLTLSESAAIQENPWQIFKPQQAVFYSLPAILFTAIDETVSDRNDYISATSRNAVYETTLSPITQPVSGSNIVVNFDASSPADTGSIKFDVLSGSTVVKSHTVSLATNVGFYLPQRWRRQPLTPVQINYGSPLAAGLEIALVPATTVLVDSSAEPIVFSTIRAGSARLFRKSAQAFQSFALPRSISSNNWTLLQEISPTPDAAAFSATGGIFSSTTERVHLHYKAYPTGTAGADARPYFADANSDQLLPTSGERLILGATINSSRLQLCTYVNGSLVPGTRTTGSTAAISVNSVELFRKQFGGGGSDAMAAGSTSAFFFVWSRALSDAEMRAVSENPWQAFRPLTRRIASIPRTVETSFNIKPGEYSVIDTPKFGRFLPQRWRKQPQGNIEIDWNNSLTNGLFLAAAPGVSGKAFHRFPTNDPNWATGNIGPFLRYQSGTRFRATTFGAGFAGNVIYTTREAGNATYSLVDVFSGGSPVYTYGVAYCQLDTPDSEFSGFSYTNSQSIFSLQANNVSTQFIARNWTAEIDTTANDHFIAVPGGVPNQKQLTSTVTWAVGQPGRIYNGKQLLASSNATVWDGGYFAYNNLYFGSYSTGKTSGLLGVTWLRALTDNDRAAFDENPWQIFRPNPGRLYGLAPAGGWPWTPKIRVTSL